MQDKTNGFSIKNQEQKMKFMMIVKANKDSEAGKMPSRN